jgi:capsular exopolysaccharide synthesis family protein
MSRNFDLMHEMERYHEVLPIPTVKPTVRIPEDEVAAYQPPLPVNDGTLNLVQKLLLLTKAQDAPRMVVFAGIEHGNGCSHIAASVAETLAGNGDRSVCLVEANFRSPALAGMFATNNDHGLSDALSRGGLIRSFVKPVRNGRLWLLSAGSLLTDSPNLLSSERLTARCAELREEFDIVVVDAPPLAHYADAVALGRLADGIVLVIEAESTRKESALAAVENLRSSEIRILGAVLNKRIFPIPEKVYSRL